jgi:predicted RNase H-like nuclease (RuvC/YqgF family)
LHWGSLGVANRNYIIQRERRLALRQKEIRNKKYVEECKEEVLELEREVRGYKKTKAMCEEINKEIEAEGEDHSELNYQVYLDEATVERISRKVDAMDGLMAGILHSIKKYNSVFCLSIYACVQPSKRHDPVSGLPCARGPTV